MAPSYTNSLINESSPYLLQHAHNPVDWHPWNDETLDRAKRENRPLLVSIGYSSCHWCHVMEKESFEDEEVARIMNENFICIKVDREERPDVDHIYMTAVQLLNRSGGWPLNAIALPDGRPFWGGTYFPREKWKAILTEIARIYKENPADLKGYATELQQKIIQSSMLYETDDAEADIESLHTGIKQWKRRFDTLNGGEEGAPKFPMPSNISFLLNYGFAFGDKEILEHVDLTLMKMSRGGIFDQIGGGFSRYSVDNHWKAPHFEKMLYDNAQLIALYSEAWQHSGNPEFRDVVYKTFDFLEREMLDPTGLWYSALDADSEGEEGLFYTWSIEELNQVKLDRRDLFGSYYSVTPADVWEKGRYILHKQGGDEEFCTIHSVKKSDLLILKNSWHNSLMTARNKRVRPSLDDKRLAGWNGLMITGLTKAYRAFGDDRFHKAALRTCEVVLHKIEKDSGKLQRTLNQSRPDTPLFLDDYAMVIQAFAAVAEITPGTRWLNEATSLTNRAIELFFDENNSMFLFNRKGSDVLVTNYYETYDNVIPSANSIMGENLFRLSRLTGNSELAELSGRMTEKMWDIASRHPMAYSGWGRLILYHSMPFKEVVVTGPEAINMQKGLIKSYLPDVVTALTLKESDEPLFKGRYNKDKTSIWVCENKSCRLPVGTVNEALGYIRGIAQSP